MIKEIRLMINLKYENLKWALRKNDKFLKINIFREYKDNPHYLQILDDLILNLRKKGCKNIQEKFRMGDRIDDFNSAICELEIGDFFLKNRYYVNFIPDRNSHISLPDLYAYKNDAQILVEVKRIVEDNYIQKLMDYLTYNIQFGLPVLIDLHINQELYNFALTGEDKDKKIQLISLLINQFEKNLLKKEYYDNININTDYCYFVIKKINEQFKHNMVIVGSIMSPNEINEILIKKLKYDIITKANSKKYLKYDHPNKIIIISIILEEQFPIRPDFKLCLDIALYGSNKDGIFYTENDLKYIGGVIGKYQDEYIFLPNPNSVDKINDILFHNYT